MRQIKEQITDHGIWGALRQPGSHWVTRLVLRQQRQERPAPTTAGCCPPKPR